MNTITIHRDDTNLDKEGEELLQATVLRALRQLHQDGSTAEIRCADRKAEGKSDAGWLEFGLLCKYATGGKLFIGCIQRRPGAAFEFHS